MKRRKKEYARRKERRTEVEVERTDKRKKSEEE